jgi:hypothetical protein
LRTVYKDGDHPDSGLQRTRDLKTDEVTGVIKAPRTGISDRVEPTGANQRDQYIGRCDRPFQVIDEVGSQRDWVNVYKNMISTERLRQPVVEPACVPGCRIRARLYEIKTVDIARVGLQEIYGSQLK